MATGRAARGPKAHPYHLKAEIAFGRLGTPEEVAGVVVFLCFERARWVTGASIIVDGGQSRSDI